MNMFKLFQKHMLSPDDIINKTIEHEKLLKHPHGKIKKIFSQLVEKVQLDAYSFYLSEEKKAASKAIKEFLEDTIPSKALRTDCINSVAKHFEEFDRFCLSLTQGRRVRAGKAFETIIRTLFKKLEYPFDEQQIINGKPDFLLPSRKVWDKNPLDCIVFTAKRTLRERWRQIVTEGTRGIGFYLATIDESLSREQLNEMKKNRIFLVVPKRLSESIYCESNNVLSFEDFFEHYLDPAVKKWKKQRVVK